MRHGIARVACQRLTGKMPCLGSLALCRGNRCQPGKGRRLPRIERRRPAIALRRQLQRIALMQGKAALQPGHGIIGSQRNGGIIGSQRLAQPALAAQRQPQGRQQPRIIRRQRQPAPHQRFALHGIARLDIGPGNQVAGKRISVASRQ